MLVNTVNLSILEQAQELESEIEYLNALAELQKERFEVEQRGNPDEYDALASKYDLRGMYSNAGNLRRKANGMRVLYG